MAHRGRAHLKHSAFKAKGNADEELKTDVSEAMIRQGRKSGQLNLSNRNLADIPDKVWKINIDSTENAAEISLDRSSNDAWWDQVDLQKLIVASNHLKCISPEIQNLHALNVFDAHDNQIESLPEELGHLDQLTKLSLNHNMLASLPKSLPALKSLRVLLLSSNKVEKLPEDFGDLINLEELDLSSNNISYLPENFGGLCSLKKLNLSKNKLQELPPHMERLSLVRDLDLQSNKLKVLPSGIECMTSLEIINCRDNLINEFPNLKGTRIKEIYLGNNRLKQLNLEAFKSLPSLVILDLKDNNIQSVPDEITLLSNLERLDISNNGISTLPAVIGNMQSIKSISVDGNPLRGIRRDIVAKGTQSLLAYLKSRIIVPKKDVPSESDTAGYVSKQPEINDNILSSSNDKLVQEIRTSKKISYCNKKAASVPDILFVDNIAVTSVDLSKNILDQVPLKLTMYSRCLTELNLSSNRLSEIPAELSTLEKLQFLDLGSNKLSGLPLECSSWRALSQIVISGNRFQAVPTILYDISSLEVLLAASNQINHIDVNGLLKLPRIATLDLKNNDITQVPPELGNVTCLKSLQIEGNPFRNPRQAILLKGTPQILEYLRDRIPR